MRPFSLPHSDPKSTVKTNNCISRQKSLLIAAAFSAGLPLSVPSLHGQDGNTYVMPEFSVTTEGEGGYGAEDAISAVRIRTPIFETASSISVVTRNMMDDLAPQRIFDATRYVAGVQEGRGIQFQDRVIIRGFESTGQRTVDNFYQPDDADNIDESIVYRIEVTKGPNAILQPAGAPGGSVNVILKAPIWETQRSITGIIGLFDAQKITLDAGGPLWDDAPYAYRVVAAYQDSRRYWSEDARIRAKVIAPMMGWRISETTELTVKLVGQQHWVFREPLLVLDPSVTAETDEPFIAPGLEYDSLNGMQPWSHVGTESLDLFVTLTTRLSDHISLRLAANGRHYHEDSDQEFLSTPTLGNRYNPSTGELTQDYIWELNEETGQYEPVFSQWFDPNAIPVRGDRQDTERYRGALQADAAARYNFDGITSDTVVGGVLARQTHSNEGWNGTLPPIDLDNPVEVYPVYSDEYAYYNKTSYANWQAYASQRIGVWDDRILLMGGIMHYDTKTKARSVVNNDPNSILDDAKNMWMASALVKVLPNVALYYSHSTNSAPTIANNAPLWRDGVQDEFGVKTEFFDRRLAVTASWFEIDQTNVTVPNPEHQTDPDAPEQLVSDLGNHGYEAEVVGRINDSFSVFGTFSHVKMRDSLGRRVRAVADDTASLLLNYRFDPDSQLNGLSMALGVTYVGSRAGDTPNPNFTPLGVPTQVSFYLEPMFGTTFSATYTWRERYTFRLFVDNILDDKDYIAVAGGRIIGTGLTSATGRNIRLSATVEF